MFDDIPAHIHVESTLRDMKVLAENINKLKYSTSEQTIEDRYELCNSAVDALVGMDLTLSALLREVEELKKPSKLKFWKK